ncbi:MAG: glutamate--tRNA ligase [Candidatus Gastranaerophilales bacterium]|nr:glutamate--tRNA ligase [Candidatus Gastranaerophilales bacterium]
MEDIRVRIAPSPSGNLHIGTARTALFNYLFAKKNNGKFVLRIEDTDLERSNAAYTQNIYDSLKALGLNWDEGPDVGGNYGPYQQSQRFDIYPKYAKKLVEMGYAYECFCTPEELEAEKEESIKNKKPHMYSGKCKNLTEAEKAKLRAEGRVPSIRFKVPQGETKYDDMVKGELKFDNSLIGDFVIMKSNGTPTYNFAVVIDDMEMKISHIIRGEDHISNTAKQIMIYNALGAEVPKFGHLGMILAPDRSKLSKRHGATAVSEFVEKGYLTEALLNFVALLGWSPSDGVEIKTLEQIASDFRIHEISSSNSVFEYDKLNWMNGQYIKKMDIKELTEKAKPFLTKYNLNELTEEQLEKVIAATREPITILSDLTYDTAYFFGKDIEYEDGVKEKNIDTEQAQNILKYFYEQLDSYDFNNEEKLHEQLAEFRTYFKEQFSIKPKETMWTVRAALTGRTHGADMGVILDVLGKEKVKYRIENAIV